MYGVDQFNSLSRDGIRFRLQSAETVIAEQRKLLQPKENMLQKYMQQFSELTANYQHMIDSHYACADHPLVSAIPAFDDIPFDVAPLLTAERAELERKLNKALPKGKVMSHLIREREEIEVRFNGLSKSIARIKLEVRRSWP
jgi:hypothetical protein